MMIEELKQLTPDTMLTIDDDSSKAFTGLEDFVVDEVTIYNCDDVDIAMISLGDYMLIASNISGEMKYAICENYDEASDYLDEDDFLDTIQITGGDEIDDYQKADVVYSCDEDDTSFAEYFSDADFNYAIICSGRDDSSLYRGIEITEDQIIL